MRFCLRSPICVRPWVADVTVSVLSALTPGSSVERPVGHHLVLAVSLTLHFQLVERTLGGNPDTRTPDPALGSSHPLS